MQHKKVAIALVLGAALCLFPLGTNVFADSSSSAATTAVQNQNINIQDNFFSPTTLSVPVGTTVVWTNNGTMMHTVTADNGSFDSGDIMPGGTFSETFNTIGTIAYFCRHHGGPGGVGMSGVITVTAATVNNGNTQSGMPQIMSFTVSPITISSGQSATLSWSTTNASSVSIDNGIGGVATSGSQMVSPTANTTYTLTATNSNGSVTMQASLTLTNPGNVTTPVPNISQGVLGWIAIPRNSSSMSSFSSPNFNSSTGTWNTSGNWLDCNGIIDNDPGHHDFNMADLDPAHHLGMVCNGSQEAWNPGVLVPGSSQSNNGSFPSSQWIIVQITPSNISAINNALTSNANANLSALFPGQ